MGFWPIRLHAWMANITNSKKSQFFFARNDFSSDIHYETPLQLKYLKVFCPNIDLGVLWHNSKIFKFFFKLNRSAKWEEAA